MLFKLYGGPLCRHGDNQQVKGGGLPVVSKPSVAVDVTSLQMLKRLL